MAPRRKSLVKQEKPSSDAPAATSSVRVTRAAAKRAAEGPPSASEQPERKPKKPKQAGKGKSKQEPKQEEPNSGAKVTVVVEHCTQCNSFKKRANRVKEGLEKGVAGIVVELNPKKPRKGCFEIRQEGGETFISLLDMKRPFTQMKQLDMDEVIADIVEKINDK